MQSKHRKKGENKKRKTSLQEGKRKSLLTLTGLLMEGFNPLLRWKSAASEGTQAHRSLRFTKVEVQRHSAYVPVCGTAGIAVFAFVICLDH